jgi:hypothetical protein
MRTTVGGRAIAPKSSHRRRGHPWPFKENTMEPTTVTDFGVGVPRRQEVEFADGTRVWLHRVEQQGVPQLFLRDLGAPGEGTRVDLRTLVPELARDLPVASTRDVPGIVHYSLRGHFGSVAELIDAVVAGAGG